ncbi:MAG: winged helix-turn-helix domain-containing protein [Ilumatobacteraceae bacterium]
MSGGSRGFGDEIGGPRTSWTFLTNHTHVLLCIAKDPTIRLRDVATMVGITERAAQSIVADLVAEGYLTRSRVGRRNVYDVHHHAPLRHSDNGSLTVGGLLDYLQSPARMIDFAHSALAPAANGHSNGNGHTHGRANGNGHLH